MKQEAAGFQEAEIIAPDAHKSGFKRTKKGVYEFRPSGHGSSRFFGTKIKVDSKTSEIVFTSHRYK